MYKTLAGLCTVLALVTYGLVNLEKIIPEPIANVVLAEKPTASKIGGQAALAVPNDLSSSQHMVLSKVYDQAKADGHAHPEIVQGIILQESKAGAMANYKVAGNKGDEYFGLGQLKVAAARDVMKEWPDLWNKYKFQGRSDEELKANLILNSAFNIELTSKYLKLLQKQYGFNGRELVNAYNRGPGGVKGVDETFHYAIGVERNIANMRKARN